MSATVVREKRQVTLPQAVVQAAGIKVKDQVDWRFEDGEMSPKFSLSSISPCGGRAIQGTVKHEQADP